MNGSGLEALNDTVRSCRNCRLSESRTNALCGEGNPEAELMLVAQAPGEKEDKEGRMFIGPSGKVLDKLLQRVGIDRAELYMTNLVKCMLPKCRRPKRDEIEACSGYLDAEIAAVQPKIIAPLGYYASRQILEKYGFDVPPKQRFHELFGTVFTAGEIRIIPLQHPAAMLHNPAFEGEMVKNYRRLKTLLEGCG